jgi:hypothetical protein
MMETLVSVFAAWCASYRRGGSNSNNRRVPVSRAHSSGSSGGLQSGRHALSAVPSGEETYPFLCESSNDGAFSCT